MVFTIPYLFSWVEPSHGSEFYRTERNNRQRNLKQSTVHAAEPQVVRWPTHGGLFGHVPPRELPRDGGLDVNCRRGPHNALPQVDERFVSHWNGRCSRCGCSCRRSAVAASWTHIARGLHWKRKAPSRIVTPYGLWPSVCAVIAGVTLRRCPQVCQASIWVPHGSFVMADAATKLSPCLDLAIPAACRDQSQLSASKIFSAVSCQRCIKGQRSATSCTV